MCLLNLFGKIFEHLILRRLKEETVSLSKLQFGFRKGCSTIDAMTRVKEIAEKYRKSAYQRRKLCLLVTLDIENAFNSVPWKHIGSSLRKKGTPPYLVQLIKSYLEDRWLIVDEKKVKITCGCPQGSVLSPYLWNVFFDDILEMDLPPDAHMVAYADCLAVIIADKGEENLKERTELILQKINWKIKEKGLKISVNKTEVVLLNTNRATRTVTFKIFRNMVWKEPQHEPSHKEMYGTSRSNDAANMPDYAKPKRYSYDKKENISRCRTIHYTLWRPIVFHPARTKEVQPHG